MSKSTSTTPPPLPPAIPQSTLTTLATYSACDISDALLALKISHGGFIPDLHLFSSPTSTTSPIVALASTLLFLPLHSSPSPSSPPTSSSTSTSTTPPNIPPTTHWTDLIPPNTILIQSSPPTHAALLGGILATRLSQRNILAVISHGRVRDLSEIRDVALPVWALGTSTVGSGGGVRAHAIDVPVEVGGGGSGGGGGGLKVTVRAGDVVVADGENGVVVVPAERVGEVLELLPRLGEADRRVKEAVRGGMAVAEAFKRFR